jgi:two-component sensor histidine kinase
MVANRRGLENVLRPRDFFDILGTGWPFRAITIVVYAAVTMLPTTASELGRLTVQSFPVALGVAVFSVCVAAGLVFLVRLILPATWRQSIPIVIGALMVAGSLRGVIVSTIMGATDLEATSHLASRVFLGALSLPPVMALVSLVVSRIVIARERAISTRHEISATERNRDRILAEIETSNTRLLEEVDETLRPAISALVDEIQSGRRTRSEMAATIDDFATDVVRPLSHTLATAGSALAEKPRRGLRQVTKPARPRIGEQISAIFSGLGVFLGSGTVLLDLFPIANAFLAALISGLCVTAVIRVLRVIVGNRQSHFFVSGIIIAVVHSAAWIPPHLINQFLIFPAGSEFQPWIVSSVAMPLLGLLYQLIVIGTFSSRTELARLDSARVDMLIQLSEARRRSWLRQRHLTHTLHSSVQSRVHAQARLLRSGKGKLSTLERDQAIGVVTSALDVLTTNPVESVDPVEAIRDLIDFWEGMCTITLDVGGDVWASTSAEPEAAQALHIVSLEMISNAIRHGHATEIAITMVRSTPETVTVTATNNGTGVPASHRAGLGMALFDELAADWLLTNGDRITVTAVIAARATTPESRPN